VLPRCRACRRQARVDVVKTAIRSTATARLTCSTVVRTGRQDWLRGLGGSADELSGLKSVKYWNRLGARFPVFLWHVSGRCCTRVMTQHDAGSSRPERQGDVHPAGMIQINTAAQLSQKVLLGIKTAFHRTGRDCGYRSQPGRTRLRRGRHGQNPEGRAGARQG